MVKLLTVLPLLLWVAALACQAADDLPVLVYPCARAAAPPVIDGRLDDACWKAAPVADSFTSFAQEALAPVQTFFRLAYDDTALYFAITCDEPTPQRVAKVPMARDQIELFQGEAIEVFLDPGHTHRAFYQLGVNPAGSLYDVESARGTAWDSEAAVAAVLGDRAWYVELAIPWRSIGVTPGPGQVHGFNVCRDRYIGAGQPWSSWARVMGTFHDPVRFAHLVLSLTPEHMRELGAEFRKDGRNGPICIATATGLRDALYQPLLRAALDKLDAQVAQLRQIAAGERDQAVRQGIEQALARFLAEADQARAALASKSADAETFARLELRLNQIRVELDDVMWQVRLETLLSGI
jgi:hypothetical protein